MLAHQVITASAGSGKTYSLTVRYLRLLCAGAAPESIVALTFSRKAAGEFFSAILQRLAGAAMDDEKAQKLAMDVGNERLGRLDFRGHLVALVRALHILNLGTYDSFFIKMARAFPYELGLGGDFSILDAHAQGLARERCFSRVFAAEVEGGDAHDLFFDFQEATHGSEDVKVASVLDRYIDEWHGLYLAAPEVERWGDLASMWPETGRPSLLGREAMDGLVRTARAAVVGLPLTPKQGEKFSEILDYMEGRVPGAAVPKILSKVIDRLVEVLPDLERGQATILITRAVELSGEVAQALAQLMRAYVEGEVVVALRQTQGIYRILAGYDAIYHEEVRRAGRLTFADVAMLLSGDLHFYGRGKAEAARESRAALRQLIDFRLDARFSHWLLDEFQDTSRLQWNVLRNLCDEVIQDRDGERSFFAVGDAKQSIHVWRGAEPGLFAEVVAGYNAGPVPLLETVPLHKSWRSGPPIIEMVNRLMGNKDVMRQLPELMAASEKWPWEVHMAAKELPGCAVVLEVPVGGEPDGDAEPDDAEEGAPEDKDKEGKDNARWAATARLLLDLVPWQRGLSCAVICSRNQRAREIAAYLRREMRVEVSCEGDVPVARDNPASSTLLAVLKAAAHAGDGLAWGQVRMSPLCEQVLQDYGPAGLDADERWRQVRAAFSTDVLGCFVTQGAAATLRVWLRRLRQASPRLDDFSVGRIEALIQCAQDWDAEGSRDVDDFVRMAEEWTQRESGQNPAVTVMTVHKSKGLTFDVVVLPDLHDRHMFKVDGSRAIMRGEEGVITWLAKLPAKVVAKAVPVLAEALEKMDVVKWGERLAQWYVATTRARYGTYFLLPAEGEQKKKKKSEEPEKLSLPTYIKRMLGWSDDLGSLQLRDKECVVRSLFGDLDWIRAFPTAAPPKPRLVQPVELQADLFADVPSALPTQSQKPVALPLRRQRPSESGAAGAFHASVLEHSAVGTLVHVLLSGVGWYHEGILAEFRERVGLRYAQRTAVEAAGISMVERALEVAAFQDVLRQPSADAVLWVERAFDVIVQGTWISGVMDRVVIEPGAGRATIIDFKSGGAERQHVGQLRQYRTALAFLTRIPSAQIQCLVVDLDGGVVVA